MATYSGSPFQTVASGRESTLAVKHDGTLESWGIGDMVPAPALSNLVSVCTSDDSFGLGVHNDGTVSFIGTSPGTLDLDLVPPTLSNVIQADSSQNHCAVTHGDGTVTCWGYNAQGQCDVPVGLNDAVMSVTGDNFTVVLKSDGTVIQFGDPPTPAPTHTNIVFISCYYDHVLCLLDDGTVDVWGKTNSVGQLDIPAGLSNVTSIAAGASWNLVTKDDGSVEVWPTAYYSVPAGLAGKVQAVYGLEGLGAVGSDGTVDMWGDYAATEINVPAGFEAMVPGDAPAATDFIDATVPFGAELDVAVGPIASFDITVPFGAAVTAHQDWTENLDPRQLKEVYRLTVTGAKDGLPDLVIGGISSWQATNQAGDRSAYLQAVVPNAGEHLEGFEARSNGDLVIEKGLILTDGTERYEEILRSNFDTFRYDRGKSSLSATLSGYLSGKVAQNGSRTLTGIRSISMSDGKYRVRCDIDLFLQPGMTADTGDFSFTADYINYYVSRHDKFCEVSER